MVSLFSINIYCSYLIEASAVKVCDLPHGHGELPTIKLNVVMTETRIVSPVSNPLLSSSVNEILTDVVLGFTPGEQQTNAVISGMLAGVPAKGHVGLPQDT